MKPEFDLSGLPDGVHIRELEAMYDGPNSFSVVYEGWNWTWSKPAPGGKWSTQTWEIPDGGGVSSGRWGVVEHLTTEEIRERVIVNIVKARIAGSIEHY